MVSVQSEYIMSADVSDEIQKPNRDDPFLLNIKKSFSFFAKDTKPDHLFVRSGF